MQRPTHGTTERQERSLHEVPSFEDFFEAHRHRLFGAMCLVTGNRSEAEEVTQDAFLRVWERWEHVSTLDDPGAYLFRVTMNVFRNRLRRAGLATRKVLSLTPSGDDLAAVEDRDEIVRALRPLPPRQRAAVVLTSYLDYSSEDAGRILGIRASTVRALATQGRAGVRQAQEEQA
jgi:RNA polymerase sigma-70 factor (ECF subfamily)